MKTDILIAGISIKPIIDISFESFIAVYELLEAYKEVILLPFLQV